MAQSACGIEQEVTVSLASAKRTSVDPSEAAVLS